jgi:hypothetical protein
MNKDSKYNHLCNQKSKTSIRIVLQMLAKHLDLLHELKYYLENKFSLITLFFTLKLKFLLRLCKSHRVSQIENIIINKNSK